MNHHHPLLVELPDDLGDEAAAQLLECLYELARGLENHYFAQIRRYYDQPPPEEQQIELWDDPPF